MIKKIFVSDKLADNGIQFLEQQEGIELTYITGLDEQSLCEKIKGHHGLIIRSGTTVTDKVIQYADSLEVIGRAGIGVDNIDIASATEKGIVVLNTPSANATTTAELTIAHILSLSRNLPQAHSSVQSGEWKRSSFIGTELCNKKLGVIGYGTIGKIVAERARGLKMNVLAYDPYVTDEVFKADLVEKTDIDEIIRTCDYITLHCPVTDKTKGLIDAEKIKLMKRGTRLINCARGELVNEQALYEALKDGRLAGAALDVFNTEPPTDSPLLTLPNVVFTPHLGASTNEAQTAVGIEITRQVVAYLQTGVPINAINLPSVSKEQLIKLKPFMQLANKLGKLLVHMIDGPIEHLEIITYGDVNELDVRIIAKEGLIGLLNKFSSDKVNHVNAALIANQHGIKLINSQSEEKQDYHSVVLLKASHGNKHTSVAGTLFDKTHARLIRINDYEIEAAMEGNLLMTRHEDQPGVIAAISTLLANQNINISRMQLGIVPDSHKAVAVLCISEILNESSIQQLLELSAINKVLQITL